MFKHWVQIVQSQVQSFQLLGFCIFFLNIVIDLYIDINWYYFINTCLKIDKLSKIFVYTL